MTEKQYPKLPNVGPIGYASVVDIERYETRLSIGPHLPGVRDVALWTTDQMRAYADADRAVRHDELEQLCAEAYQVVGVLLDDTGQFNTEHACKILDNLSQMRRVHDDVLPWESVDMDAMQYVEQARAALASAAQPSDAAWDKVLRERDDADDFIDALLDEVLGADRPEWSNLYDRADALDDVRERMAVLEAPDGGCVSKQRSDTIREGQEKG